MKLHNKMIIDLYLSSIRFYKKSRKFSGINLQPNSNHSKSNLLFLISTKIISRQFDPAVRNEISFYLKNHFDLEDLQEGLGMCSWLDFVRKTDHLEGDVLELGIYKGGTTTITAHYLNILNSKRQIYACEAFIGLPYEDKYSTSKGSKGRFSDTNPQLVLQKFQKFNVSERIKLLEGLFENTLYQQLSDKKFSLVLLDCDVYDAAKYALDFVYPRLTNGGIVMFDDYEKFDKDNPLWGETKAVDEFCAKNNIKVNLYPEPHIIKL